MTDDTNLGLTPWSREQYEKAPQIRRTDTQLRQLFSFEVAQIEAKHLFLPGILSEAQPQQFSASLLSLSSLIKEDKAIQIENIRQNEDIPPGEETLFVRIRIGLARLLSSGSDS